MEATQMNYDASQILEDENDPGYSDGSKEEEEEEAGGNLCLKTALIRTLTLQLSEANNEIEKLNCEIEQASDQPVVQVETISRLQTENQKLTSELETTQKALSEKESASNACDVGMAHQQGQSPSPLQLEIDELKDKLEDAMKQSQTNYDGWINADKQWKVEWTAAKEKSKADFDGCNAANNEARQNWDRYVCAAKNFKQEEEEVKRLRETARQVDHGASRVLFHLHRQLCLLQGVNGPIRNEMISQTAKCETLWSSRIKKSLNLRANSPSTKNLLRRSLPSLLYQLRKQRILKFWSLKQRFHNFATRETPHAMREILHALREMLQWNLTPTR
jgi:chromosome segregation ATPase